MEIDLDALLADAAREQAITPEHQETRERAYAAMGQILDPLGTPAVLVAFNSAAAEAHIVIHVPGNEASAILELGRKALYALSLYTLRLEAQMAEAADPVRQT